MEELFCKNEITFRNPNQPNTIIFRDFRDNDLIVRFNEMLFRNYEMLFRFYEIIIRFTK